MQARDISRLRPELALGLYHHPEDAALIVEVVDVVGAQIGLHGGEDVGQRDAQRFCLVAVDLEKQLRDIGAEGAENARQGRVLVGIVNHGADRLCQFLGRLARDVLHLEVEAAGCTKAWNGRRCEGKDIGLGDRGKLTLDLAHDGIDGQCWVLAFIPGVENDDGHAAI